MKRFYGLTTMVATLIIALCLPLQSATAHALAPATCTLAMLQGSYPFVAPATIVISQGTVIAVPEADLYASPAAYASQGTVVFDGNGHVQLQATADQHGKLGTPIVYNGTVAVNNACTAQVTLANHSTFSVRMIQAGKQLRLVSTTPGFVLIAAH